MFRDVYCTRMTCIDEWKGYILNKSQQTKFFIDRHAGGDRAVLVHVDLYAIDAVDALQEFQELVRSAGVENLALVTAKLGKPDVGYFVGSGKAREIADVVKANAAEVVIVNHDLSSSQERNLEKLFQCRVVDRTGLILDIFAQRARTFEGKLQVELAQLQHLSTRLVRGWTHLERQKGGIGLRGPGETQLESDKRLLDKRIQSIKKSLVKVAKQRHQNRRRRQRAAIPGVSLVGYTNAGKSTLFNALTEAKVYAADQLFATLDPTLRMLSLPPLNQIMLADTVGFIRDLPHDLVAAFKATLEETREATLLLHVIDATHPEKQNLIDAVEQVLKEIAADQLPVLQIYNKIDLDKKLQPHIERDSLGLPSRVYCAAVTGEGLDLVRAAITELLAGSLVSCELLLDAGVASSLRAQFYNRGVVISERVCENNQLCLTVKLQRSELDHLMKNPAIKLSQPLL